MCQYAPSWCQWHTLCGSYGPLLISLAENSAMPGYTRSSIRPRIRGSAASSREPSESVPSR